MYTRLSRIHHFILDHFDQEELRTLCFYFGVKYDNLAGETLDGKAREFLLWARRRSQLDQLLLALRDARPIPFDQAGLSLEPSKLGALYGGPMSRWSDREREYEGSDEDTEEECRRAGIEGERASSRHGDQVLYRITRPSLGPAVSMDTALDKQKRTPRESLVRLLRQLFTWDTAATGLALTPVVLVAWTYRTKLEPNGLNYLVLAATLLVIALRTVLPTRRAHREAVSLAERRQRQAMDELRDLIKQRLYYSDDRFLKAYSVRALAARCEGDPSSPVSPIIGDSLIAEVVREIAWDLEKAYSVLTSVETDRGETLRGQLDRLQNLLDELEGVIAKRPPLLSVAQTDRLAAYRLSEPSRYLIPAIIVLFILQFAFPAHLLVGVAFWILIGLELSAILSSIRTRNYWKTLSTPKGEAQGVFTSILSPKQLNPVLDFFSFITITRDQSFISHYNTWGATFWEALFFLFPPEFMKMHQIGYLRARPVKTRFKALHQRLAQLQIELKTLPPSELDEYRSLCKELWAITGSPLYRTLDNHARTGRVLNIDVSKNRVTPDSRFRTLRREFVLCQLGEKCPEADTIEEYVLVCRELADATDQEQFRKLQHEAEVFLQGMPLIRQR